MIEGMTVDWALLRHAYGSASDLPRLFEDVGDPEAADVAWEDLWASLCHQGTVYTASFASLPVLADIATGRKPGASGQALGLAGRIVAEEHQLHEPGYVQARYPAAVRELHQLTLEIVVATRFEGDADDFLFCLEDLLAFEGVPVWRHRLRRDEHGVSCPACAQSLWIDLTSAPAGTRRRDPGRSFRVVGREGPLLTGVHPSAPGDLPPLAHRLRDLAVRAGQSEAAEHLLHLFGRTTCPDCASDFAVSDQVAASDAERP
ncbi:hypothetical protein [Streptacidiphilus cavernicola]|uniref:Uncharacterized protein n=1 Tax=Streptacidiphilus cavernicola TaxID=3342716 RepID=A0ABV6VVV5_9ACTN